jgi:cytochrome c oxidase subunit 3
MDMGRERVAVQFEDMPKQAHAARLGMWIFLASEVLLFAGLFALYASYRAEHPSGFGEGVRHNTRVLGSINTAVLLVSSYFAALGLHQLRRDRRRLAVLLTSLTIALGAVFLAIKFVEYRTHFREGIYPGGVGRFFAEHHADQGMIQFWTLYFFMTGLHAVHVTVGMGVLAFVALRVARARVTAAAPHPLELAAIYWHLVDVIWIFLWPLFYLVPTQ